MHSTDTFRPRSSNVLQPITAFSRGDVDAALANAAHVIEATFQTQPVDIAFLEPEACLAVPQGDGVKVHTESQGSVYDHQQIAKVLNLDPGHVEIALCASGGAFGAKEELSIQAQTAIAAHLLGRPVKTVLTREQSTQHHVKRHAMTIALTVGADADGHLLALRSRIVADAGGYHTTSAKCVLRAACHSCGLYRVPNVDVESKAVYTNNPNERRDARLRQQPGAVRAWKASMDMLAERVGVDGWDIRERNILNPGDAVRHRPDHARERPRHPRDARRRQGRLQEREVQGHRLRHQEHGPRQRHHRRRLHHHPRRRGPRLEILNGYTEMGQGVYTATMQAVCEETDLPAELMTRRVGQGARREVRRDVGVAGDDA